MNPTECAIAAQPRRSARGKRLLLTFSLLALCGIAFGVKFQGPLFRGNFGVVDPGRVYRCAQPQANWSRLFEEHRLATVLNLRGGTMADPWYADEVRATREKGVDFYDLSLSATRRPSRGELLVLLDLLGRCRYPLLIHCKSGADRTGLVSGLYLLSQKGVGPREALAAFSYQYGHVPFGGPERLHEPFEEYASWLNAKGVAHSPALFQRWVEQEYASEGDKEEPAPLQVGPRRHRSSARR